MQGTPSESVHRNNGLALMAEVRILAQSRPLIAPIYAHRDIQSLTSSKPFQANETLRGRRYTCSYHTSRFLHTSTSEFYEFGEATKRECAMLVSRGSVLQAYNWHIYAQVTYKDANERDCWYNAGQPCAKRDEVSKPPRL